MTIMESLKDAWSEMNERAVREGRRARGFSKDVFPPPPQPPEPRTLLEPTYIKRLKVRNDYGKFRFEHLNGTALFILSGRCKAVTSLKLKHGDHIIVTFRKVNA